MSDMTEAWDDYMGDYYRAEGREKSDAAAGEYLAFVAGWRARTGGLVTDIRTEAEFMAAPVGTVMRDRNGDVFEKATERGAWQTNLEGLWGPTWVAYPAAVLERTSIHIPKGTNA
jgi:hypothetical protein